MSGTRSDARKRDQKVCEVDCTRWAIPGTDRCRVHTGPTVLVTPAEREKLRLEAGAARAQMRPRVVPVVESAAAQITELRQALWDIYGILGFDQDGDPTPAALRPPPLTDLVVNAAREARADSDAALDDLGLGASICKAAGYRVVKTQTHPIYVEGRTTVTTVTEEL